MKAALAGLTTRGRSLLAAGVAAIGCAVALGENDLLRVGVMLTAVPLVGAAFMARSRYRLTCRRGVEPARVAAGREAAVSITVENVSRLPTGLLLVEDRIPNVLGGSARFVVDRVEHRGARGLRYRVRSEVRGVFRLGPLAVRLADPLGTVELTRSFATTDTLVVTPLVVPLPRTRVTGAWAAGGEGHARTTAAAGEDDVSPREYRHGDDLRRVHWRSTARYGELMVRREEQLRRSRGTVLLDTRRTAHRGEGPASSFEQAVSVAASVGVHLIRDGFGLRLLTDAAEMAEHSGGVGYGAAFEGMLLDTLAVVQPSRLTSLRYAVQALGRRGADERDGVVVAVCGLLDAAAAQALARVPHRGGLHVAVVVDGPSGRGAVTAPRDVDDGVQPTAVLRRAGWRVLRVRDAADLAAAWRTLDRKGPATRAARGSDVANGSRRG